MDQIAVYEKQDPGKTAVSNYFIDYYMTRANEAQIKVYLYLLRSVSGSESVSVSSIADRFNYTERDILRALKYWDEQGLLSLDFDCDRNVQGICLNDASRAGAKKALPEREEVPFGGLTSPGDFRQGVPMEPSLDSGESSLQAAPVQLSGEAGKNPRPDSKEDPAQDYRKEDRISGDPGNPEKTPEETRPFYSQERLEEFQNREDVGGLFFMTEQYLGHPLSKADVSTVLYMYDHLKFGVDLIEFLIEYCVSGGHRNMRYIEATALAWHEQGILDVKAARAEIQVFHRDYYAVLRAFGLGGRNPVKADIDYIRRWKDEYGFDMEIIIEAVNRTMRSISKPSFSYADGILQSWRKSRVRTKADIEALDEARERNGGAGAGKKTRQAPADDRFRNFSERSYDYDALKKTFAKN